MLLLQDSGTAGLTVSGICTDSHNVLFKCLVDPMSFICRIPKGQGDILILPRTQMHTTVFQVLTHAEEKTLVFQGITLLPAELFTLI